MKYFTPEDFQPSEKTLRIIRQIARSYNEVKDGNNCIAFIACSQLSQPQA